MATQKNSESTSHDLNLNDTAIAFAAMSDRQLQQALLLFKVIGNPFIVQLGPTFAALSLKLHLPVQTIIKKTIFSHFCGGETIQACLPRISELHKSRIGTILDFAREGGGRESDFDLVAEEIKKTIDMAAQYPDRIPFAVFKPTGVASINLLAQHERGEALSNEQEAALSRARARFSSICEHAAKLNIPIMIDAEESWIQNTVDAIALELMQKLNKKRAIVFNTVQLYRHDRGEYMRKNISLAQSEGFHLGFKLVRGAYLEKENSQAAHEGRPSPLNASKEATDREYNTGLQLAIENIDCVSICAGTHNEDSVRLLANLMHKHSIANNDSRVIFAQLLGMSDHISYNLAAKGYRVAKYMPYGTVAELLPYLTRRAQENSSVLGQSSREHDLLHREVIRRKKAKHR